MRLTILDVFRDHHGAWAGQIEDIEPAVNQAACATGHHGPRHTVVIEMS